MTAREQYRQLCETEGARIPLFQQYWWWETVCRDKRWDVLLCERDGRVTGAMPYLDGRRLGLRHSLMPQLTMFTGPWLADPHDQDTFDLLYRRLMAFHPLLYVGRLSPALTAAGLTAPKGFRTAQHHTYRFDPIRPLPELLAGASQLRRRDNSRLAAELTLDDAVSPKAFADLHATYIAHQGKRDLLPRGLIVRVCTEAVGRGHGLVLGARGADGTLHAALFLAYDSECAYLLMLARNAEAPRNAMSYLIWQAIDRMAAHSRAFDFEGSMEPGVEKYYRSFGPQKTYMMQLSRSRLPFYRL